MDLLDERLYQRLLADPGAFADRIRTLPEGSWVVIDEVQRLPGLLNTVHRAMELQGLRFVLSGSSARKLRRSGVNLLAGRALRREIFPFVPEELGENFDMESAFRYGTVPVVWSSPDREETLLAYVETYLKEEVQAEALVRNLSGFARFLPIAALFHGQVVNAAGIARDSGVSRSTVLTYLEILQDTLLTFSVPGWEPRLRVRERQHPKLYWLDPGIVRGIKGRLGPVAAEERGVLFEGWVATLLRTYGSTRRLFDSMSYWAPAEARSTEVDFVLQRGDERLAIEVKASTRTDGDRLRGLRAIAELPNLRRRVLVYLGEDDRRTEAGIDIWTPQRLASELANGTIWGDR